MELDFISAWGEKMSLTNNENFYLTAVDGLTKSTTDMSTIIIGGYDGDILNNIQAQPRGLILDLRIKSGVDVEQAKRQILSVIKIKQLATLEWTQNNRTLAIQGTVESIEMPRFNNSVTMQVTIHCSQPFWEDVEEIMQELSEAKPLHYFTANIGDMLYFTESGRPLGEYDTSRTRQFINNGDVSVGMHIEILAYSTVTNPIIYDQSGNFFGVGQGAGSKRFQMQQGDKLFITTVKGQKSILYNGSNTYNNNTILDYIKQGSTWLQLQAGVNEFSINSDDTAVDNMSFTLSYKQRYI